MYLKQDNNINQVAHGRLGRGQPPELTTITQNRNVGPFK